MAEKEFQIQPDSPPMLPHGMATPYIAIFNSQLAVIRDPKSGLPLGSLVTRFEYVYNEEKVDTGKIDIECDNPDLASLTELSYGQGLQIQWGYIYSDKTGYYSPVRKVIITGNQIVFGQTGVKITLEISDSSILLKNSPANYYDNTKGFVQYVKDLCEGVPIGIALIDYNEKERVRKAVAQRVMSADEVLDKYGMGINSGAEWATELPTNSVSPDEMVHTPTTVVPDAVGVKILEWTPENGQLVFSDPDNFRKVYLEETVASGGLIVGTSRSKYYQLQDVCRSLSGGPFFVDSRDDMIILHNVKSQRNITKVYTYMGGCGELLEFSIKSSYIKTSTEVKQSTTINPNTKAVETDYVQAVVDPNSGNPDTDGVDTFMVWPNLGSPFWNPRGGTTSRAPHSAAFQPIPGKPNSSQKPEQGSEYHVMLDDSATARAINATTEKPGTTNRSFSSLSEARQFYTTHPSYVQQSEIDEYFGNWMKDWRADNQATDANSLSEMAHRLDRIPPMIIKRHIKIATYANVQEIGRHLYESGTSTEAFQNAVLTGQVDLSTYDRAGYAEGVVGNTGQYSISQLRGFSQSGLAVLNSLPGVNVSVSNAPHRPGHSHNSSLVIIEGDFEIKMNGVDVVSGADTINMPGSMGNDIIEKVTNKVKAQAKVIGDPVLESSMNIQVQNVSAKFTGLWYTKKVTHVIDSNGYTCDIEFVQRTIPVSTVTLRSNWTKKDYGKQVLTAIKAAAESGSYNEPSKIESTVKSQLREAPESFIVIQKDPLTGEVKSSQLDMQSGSYMSVNGKTHYQGGDINAYIQDLQK